MVLKERWGPCQDNVHLSMGIRYKVMADCLTLSMSISSVTMVTEWVVPVNSTKLNATDRSQCKAAPHCGRCHKLSGGLHSIYA